MGPAARLRSQAAFSVDSTGNLKGNIWRTSWRTSSASSNPMALNFRNTVMENVQNVFVLPQNHKCFFLMLSLIFFFPPAQHCMAYNQFCEERHKPHLSGLKPLQTLGLVVNKNLHHWEGHLRARLFVTGTQRKMFKLRGLLSGWAIKTLLGGVALKAHSQAFCGHVVDGLLQAPHRLVNKHEQKNGARALKR